MKLYVKKGDKKIYLRNTAKTRIQFAKKIGGHYFRVKGTTYNVNQVLAEKDGSDTITGGVIGGALGLFGGPIGVLAGLVIGGIIGNSSESKEEQEIRQFNRS